MWLACAPKLIQGLAEDTHVYYILSMSLQSIRSKPDDGY